jgi:hypothetical protein
MQLGMAGMSKELQVWLFCLSLSGPAFSWYSSLPAGAIHSWSNLEERFHMYFFAGVSEIRIFDLAALRQRQSESVLEYIQRFKEVRNKCYSLWISDAELADLAFEGLLAPIKERFTTCEFESLSHLLHKVSAQERCLQEQRNDQFIFEVVP